MIRFIDLSDQITCDGTREFAWFDTMRGKFIELNNCQTWQSWVNFEQDLKNSLPLDLLDDEDFSYNRNRFLRLFHFFPGGDGGNE